MKKKKSKSSPISDVLRETIAESGMSLLGIERETGVKRQSIMRFLRGERSLRLDIADKLAAYFGLRLRKRNGPVFGGKDQ